jgi:hypothetical protein
LRYYVCISGLSCRIIFYKMWLSVSPKEIHHSVICSAGDASKNLQFNLVLWGFISLQLANCTACMQDYFPCPFDACTCLSWSRGPRQQVSSL